MASLLHRLGAAAYRRRHLVIVVWLVLLVGAGVGAATLSGPTKSGFDLPGQESTDALTRIDEEFGAGGGASAQVVFHSESGAITSRREVARVQEVLATLRDLDGVAAVSDPYDAQAPTVAPDQEAAYATVTFSDPVADVPDAERDALLDAVAHASTDSLSVDVTGDVTEAPVEVAGPAEIVGVVVAFLVLALTYGALAAAGMNMLTALVGVGSGVGGILVLTGFVQLQSTTTVLAMMLGLAVGIDYALFIVTRFRENLRQGLPVPEAVALATGTAGSAVVTAGVTVVIALAALAVIGVGFITEMGLGAAATVVIAVLVAITLVPALLGVLGERILPKRERGRGRGAVSSSSTPARPSFATRVYGRWSTLITRRAAWSLLAGVALLAVVAVPAASMQTSLIQPEDPDSTQGRAEDVVSEHFGPGFVGPLVLLVEGRDAAAVAGRIADTATELDNVVAAGAPTINADRDAATVTVIPGSAPSAEKTSDLVTTLRTTYADASDADVSVTGQTAVSVDVGNQLSGSFPWYLALIVGLALLLLVLVFRSVAIPVLAVVGFLLTIAASFGATVAVFQWGWLASVLGVTATGPLLSLMPVLVVGILFGLAMDYQVFLVSAMHEAHAAGASARQAIERGFKRSAPVVVAAAAIMFAVFAGFIPSGDPTIKILAVALSVGILADAFVVRMIVVPAAMSMLGSRAWSLPRWLRWLPRVDVEGAALEHRR